MAASVWMRTHFWDAAVALCHARASAALGCPVPILADMTEPFDLPAGIPCTPFRLADFPARGLPLLPEPDRAMWMNGDYAFMLLAEIDPDAEAFLLMDGDCCANGVDLRALVARLTDSGVDFCAPYTYKATPQGWPVWHAIQTEWYAAEYGADHGIQIWQSFFPFVWLSRRAIAHLRARRLEMAALQHDGLRANWPICESFVPTELMRQPGFAITDLAKVLPGPLHVTYWEARAPEELAAMPARIVHPVLTGARLARKILQMAVELAPEDTARQIAMVEAALARNLGAEALETLREARSFLSVIE